MPRKEDLYDEALEHFAKNELEEAVAVFTRATEQYPDYADGYLGLAHSYERQSKYDEAIEAIQQAIKINPNDHLAYTSLSVCYQRKGMIQEAEDAKAKSLQMQMGN